MNAKQQIREALRKIMSEGEANACQIWKGFGGELSGWHYQKFGATSTFIGDNLVEALDWISELAEARRLTYGK